MKITGLILGWIAFAGNILGLIVCGLLIPLYVYIGENAWYYASSIGESYDLELGSITIVIVCSIFLVVNIAAIILWIVAISIKYYKAKKVLYIIYAVVGGTIFAIASGIILAIDAHSHTKLKLELPVQEVNL